MRIASQLTRHPWMIAVGLSIIVVIWLASGLLKDTGKSPGADAESADALPAAERISVQVRAQQAEPITRTISIYGRSTPVREVELKAETNGRVAALLVDRGKAAASGTVLLKLDLRDREARLAQARASVNEHEAAFKAQQELKPQGYVSDTQLAETRAKLEAARTELTRAELDLEYMNVRAPFNGTMLDRTVEVGDFVRAGDPVATFVDNTHLIITGSVAEQDAAFVRVGRTATAVLVTGEEVEGRIRYIAPVAQEATRTFTIEVEVPNPQGKLPAGVTAEMRIPGGEVMAYKISPSLLSLDAGGKLGVKTVDKQGRVVFHTVSIARSGANGVWVTGLPEAASIIVVGQGYVSEGEPVRSVEAPAPETALAAGQAPVAP